MQIIWNNAMVDIFGKYLDEIFPLVDMIIYLSDDV